MKLHFTTARQRGLDVLAAAERANVVVRVSNTTNVDSTKPTVYWQTADWLRANGLAEPLAPGSGALRLTDQGRRIAGVAGQREVPTAGRLTELQHAILVDLTGRRIVRRADGQVVTEGGFNVGREVEAMQAVGWVSEELELTPAGLAVLNGARRRPAKTETETLDG